MDLTPEVFTYSSRAFQSFINLGHDPLVFGTLLVLLVSLFMVYIVAEYIAVYLVLHMDDTAYLMKRRRAEELILMKNLQDELDAEIEAMMQESAA